MKRKIIKNLALVIMAIAGLFGCDGAESHKVIKVQHSKSYSTIIIDGELQKDTLTFEQKTFFHSDGIKMYRLILFGGYNNDTIWMGTEKELNGKTYTYGSDGELAYVKIIQNDTIFYYDNDDDLEYFIVNDDKGEKEIVFKSLIVVYSDRAFDEYGNIVYSKSETSLILGEYEYKHLNLEQIKELEENSHKIAITETSYQYY